MLLYKKFRYFEIVIFLRKNPGGYHCNPSGSCMQFYQQIIPRTRQADTHLIPADRNDNFESNTLYLSH